jgi:DNA polymerase-3 subunit delta'
VTGVSGASGVSGVAGEAEPDRPVPELFAEVVGQPAAVATLRAAARRPVHAYLFVGPPGSGARPAARGFAAALLCPNGGCGQCDVCRRVLAGTHPDVVVVERTGASLSVDDARRLVNLAQRRPFEADRQVLVATDVHLADRSAPVLLKTVEEPPASTVFVLLADDVTPELVTVASRCVEVAFPPVAKAAVVDWLAGQGVDPDRADLIAEGAGGNLDRARLLAADESYAGRLALWRAVPSRLDGHGATAGSLARELLDAADAALGPLREAHADELQRLADQAEALGDRGVPGRKEVTDRHHREERRWRTDELRVGLGVLARAYRDRLADAVSTPVAGAVPPDEGRGYATAVGLVTETAAALERNPNETLLLEALLVRLGRLD